MIWVQKNIMSEHCEYFDQIQNGFSGIVPVLDLDDCVLLPDSVVSLRISKTADCQLIADALAENSLIAVSLKGTDIGSKNVKHEGVNINFVCLAKMVSAYRLDSGYYSVLLQGICRARSQRLSSADEPCRKTLLELKPDYYSDLPVIDREHRQLELLELYSRIYSQYFSDPIYYHVLHQSMELGKLCDTLASSSSLEPALCQQILDEYDVDLRSDLLLSFLKNKLREQQNNPFARSMSMEFSKN